MQERFSTLLVRSYYELTEADVMSEFMNGLSDVQTICATLIVLALVWGILR